MFDPVNDPEEHQKVCDATNLKVQEVEERVCNYIMKGMKLGLELVTQGLPDHWLVYNGCVHFWNWHLQMLQDNDYLPIRECAEFCYSSLLPIIDLRDAALLTKIGVTLIRSLVQHYMRRVTPASVSDVDVIRMNASTFERTDPQVAHLLHALQPFAPPPPLFLPLPLSLSPSLPLSRCLSLPISLSLSLFLSLSLSLSLSPSPSPHMLRGADFAVFFSICTSE